jgi:NAD(P)-dependent dehydrogenase (short-subunit alcohol dehydrogenase family)
MMKVVVTGASGALGRAVVDRLVRAGDRVACVDRVIDSGQTHADPSLHWFVTDDLAEPGQATETLKKASGWLGGLDSLVHLVGAFDWRLVEQSNQEDWRALYRANVETAVATTKAGIGFLEKEGAIVLIGAASAEPASGGMAPYAAAKSAIARLTEALAAEFAPRKIRVNALLPSIIDTPRNRRDMPDANFNEWTSTAALADVIHFLASPASRALNGAKVEAINGGV